MNDNPFVGIFQQKGIVKNGDRIQSISYKYRDENKKEPIGPTYMEYVIFETKPLENNKFYTKGIAYHELQFNNIKKGTLYTEGLSERVITLDNEGNVVKLEVVKSEFLILGGSGDFENCKGSYHIKNVKNFYKGILKCYKYEKKYTKYIFFSLYLVLLVFLFLFLLKNKI